MQKTAAIYVRVSTEQQTTENQLDELQRLATARGWLTTVYAESESAAKDRPVFNRMLNDARAGKFQILATWALDRLSRSMAATLNLVLELDSIGVQVVSLRESWLDTSGPARSLLLGVFGWCAEQERHRLIERTKSGLARAKRKGVRLGRPPCSPVLLGAARDRVAKGMSVRGAARDVGVPEAVLRRFLKAASKTSSPAP